MAPSEKMSHGILKENETRGAVTKMLTNRNLRHPAVRTNMLLNIIVS